MSDISALINQVKVGDEEDLQEDFNNPANHIDTDAFDKLFNEAQEDVLRVTGDADANTEIVDAETISVVSTLSKSSKSSKSSKNSHRTIGSVKSNRTANSIASTKVSKLTEENLKKNELEEEMKIRRHVPSLRSAKSNRSQKSSHSSEISHKTANYKNRYKPENKLERSDIRSVKSTKSIKSVKSDVDYSSLAKYKSTLKQKTKKQHNLDLTGSPIEIIDRIDDLVNDICSEYTDPDVKKDLKQQHRDMILIQVFLNTMNTNRRDIAKACRETISSSKQKKLPAFS